MTLVYPEVHSNEIIVFSEKPGNIFFKFLEETAKLKYVIDSTEETTLESSSSSYI